MRQSDAVLGLIAGGVTAAVLVGVVEFERYRKGGAVQAVSVPASAGGNSSAVLASQAAQAALDANAAKEAAQQKAAQIQDLRQQLAEVWNQMDVLAVQLSSIAARSPAPGLEQEVKLDLYRQCEAALPFNFLFSAARCDGTVAQQLPGEVKKRWAASLVNEEQPFQAQLSAADYKQKALIQNLAALGYTVPLASVRKGTT